MESDPYVKYDTSLEDYMEPRATEEDEEEFTEEELNSLIIIPDEDVMLTTMDNPFSPIDDYDQWRIWDIEHGYNTEDLIARLADVDPLEAYTVVSNRILEAKIAIASNDAFGKYKLV